MPSNFDIKIVLPANLKSLYLSDPEMLKADQNSDYSLSDKGIINTADNYFVGKLSLDPSLTENKTRLVFGIRLKRRDILTDNNTEQFVDLKTIRSLTLSNSPDFENDSNSTIEIKNWPFSINDTDANNKVTGSNKNYIYNLNPLSFYDSSVNFDSGVGYGRAEEQDGQDLFIINNWPLSANGGLSTIFIKIIARSILDSTDIVYPGNAAIFDQITWQSDPGIRPGVPVPILRYAAENHISPPNKIYTGEKTLFRFAAANEQSSSIPGQINKDGVTENADIFGSGIGRYTGDIYEIRGSSTSYTDYGIYSWRASTTLTLRNIAPDFPTISTSVIKHDFDGLSYSNSTIVHSNTSIAGILSTSSRGVSLLLNTAFTNTTAHKPDMYAQAYLQIEPEPTKPFDYNILFKFNKFGLSAPETNSYKEIGIEVKCTNFVSSSKVYKNENATSTSVAQINNISNNIVRDLAEGGLLEIYLSKLRRPQSVSNTTDFDNKAIFKAYFTPANNKAHSYLLANATLSDLNYSAWFTSSVTANITVLQYQNNVNYNIKELASGSGRILLDLDLGDCKYDDVQLDFNDVVNVTSWKNKVGQFWNKVEQGFSTTEVTTVAQIDDDFFVSSRIKNNGRSYTEFQCLTPTFSDRVKIDFFVAHYSGDFYVALYSKPLPNSNTAIASYLDEAESYSSNVNDQPALMINFSENSIKLHQKVTPTNEVVVHDIVENNLQPSTFNQSTFTLGLSKVIGTTNTLLTHNIFLTTSKVHSILTYEESGFNDFRSGYLILNNQLAPKPLTPYFRTLYGQFPEQPSTSIIIYNDLVSETQYIQNFNQKYRIYYNSNVGVQPWRSVGNLTDMAVYTTSGTSLINNYTYTVQLFFDNNDMSYNSTTTYFYHITSAQEAEIQDFTAEQFVAKFNEYKKLFTIDFSLFTDRFNFTKNSTTVIPVLTSKNDYQYDYLFKNNSSTERLLYKSDFPNEFLGIWNYVPGTSVVYLYSGSEQNYIYNITTSPVVSARSFIRNFGNIGSNYQLYVNNGPQTDENILITLNKNGNQIANFSVPFRLPGDRMGLGWYFAIGTRSQLNTKFGTYTSSVPLNDSRLLLSDIKISSLPPRETLDQTDLSNQRHFMKAIGYSVYQKPLLGQLMIAGNTDFWNFDYKTGGIGLSDVIFAQQFVVNSRSNESICNPNLLELKFEDYRKNPIDSEQELPSPEVKIFHFTNPIDPYLSSESPDKLSYIGTSLMTTWIKGQVATDERIALTGFNVPNNTLIQFNLDTYQSGTSTAPLLINGQRYWLAIKVPQGMNLARTRGFEVATRILKKDYSGNTLQEGVGTGNNAGWQIVPYVWFKLFHSFRERYDNIFPQASLQMRVAGESHAKVSTEFSGLSRMVEVDIEGPTSSNDFSLLNYYDAIDDKNRPSIIEILQPSVRTALIKIKAADNQSGNWLFRIGKETDFGNLEYTDWLDWDTYRRKDAQNLPIQNEISYSIFLYGSAWLNPKNGQPDPYTNSSTYTAQNMGTDGPRKVWVEVMDRVGNRTQSFPVTLNGQLIGLVDTVPPEAELSIIAPDNVIIDYTNSEFVIIKVIADDTISSVKDMRFRIIDGSGTQSGWSAWYHYSEIVNTSFQPNITVFSIPINDFETPIAPGGPPVGPDIANGGIGSDNNVPPPPPPNPTFSTSTNPVYWYTPETSPVTGLKRIEVQVRDYGNNSLQPSSMWSTLFKDSYLSRNSFVTLSNTPSAFADGVLQFPRNIFINCSVIWKSSFENSPSVYFGAVKYDNFIKNQSQDEIIFNNLTWNVENEKAYELLSTATGYYKRKIILNSFTDTIELSINGVSIPKYISNAETPGTTYRIDANYGYLIIKNIQNIPSFNTPIFSCTINRAEAQIYKWDYNSIQKIASFGYSGERIILSMVALNKEIIFGTGSGNVWAFDGLNFRGPLFTATDLSSNKLPITSICVHEFLHETNPFIYVGTGKKSFLFRTEYFDTDNVISLTATWERCKGEPFYDKPFTITSFTSAYNALFITTKNGKVFKYIRKQNRTNSNLITQIAVEFNINPTTINPYDSKILPISSSLTMANQVIIGIADRPEIFSYTEKVRQLPAIGSNKITNLFEHKLTDVRAATTTAINWEYTGSELIGAVNENLVVDSVTLVNNDRVLIKNQSNTMQNGIYIFRKSSGSQSRLVRAMDMEYNSKIKINTYVYCTHGLININKYFYMLSAQNKEYADVIIGIDPVNFSSTKEDTKYLFSRWTTYNFDKNFIQSPMTKGAFQFYINNGESDSRNKPDFVYTKTIEDFDSEGLTQEVMFMQSPKDEIVLFETKLGSDWSIASSLPGPYTLEFEVSGSGEFEVATTNTLVKVYFTNNSVTVNGYTKSFRGRNQQFTPYSIIPEVTPKNNIIYLWNFSFGDEDLNIIENQEYPFSLNNWRAVKFATIGPGGPINSKDNWLVVNSALVNNIKGDPIIGVESVTNYNQSFFVADTHTFMTVRLKLITSYRDAQIVDYSDENISTKQGLTFKNKLYQPATSILLRGQNDPTENGVYKLSEANWLKTNDNKTSGAAIFYRDSIGDTISSINYWYTSRKFTDIKLKTYWDSNSYMTEESLRLSQPHVTPLVYGDNFLTYKIKPAWYGPVSCIYFEFENIKNASEYIAIDYVSIQSDSGIGSEEIIPIRLSLCGDNRKDIKLWIGKTEEPLIELDNAVEISNITLNPYIKFGNFTNRGLGCIWKSMKFHVGHVIPPVASDVQDFHPTHRFSSTGGVSVLAKHAGTIWCITDGIYLRKSTDNPDDHTFKTWKYIPEDETWRYESPTPPLTRIAGQQPKGNIKVFTAISYKGGLVAAGQIGEVGNANPRPEESS